MSPRTLFRIVAIAEAITWAALIAAMISRAVDAGDFVSIAGGAHGFVFLCYCVSTVFVWVNQRWRAAVGLTGLALAVVPLATVPFEMAMDRGGLLRGGWRLAPGGEAPRTAIEHVQAWILRHIGLAAVLVVAAVIVVFVTLLWLGPPV